MREPLSYKTGLYIAFYLTSIAFAVGIAGCQNNKLTYSNDPIIKLIDLKEEIKETSNEFICDTCILSIEFRLDTSIIQIVTPSNCMESTGNIKVLRDTLTLYSGTKPEKVDTIIEYNDDTKQIDTTIVISMSAKYGPSHCMNILTYRVCGLEKNPVRIRFNDQLIEECKSRESFRIQNNDTINRTDWYGLRQGLWIEERNKKDYYENGFRQNRSEVVDEFGDTLIIYQLEGSMDIGLRFYKK